MIPLASTESAPPSTAVQGRRRENVRVGIDVGGTHTDIVVLGENGLLLSADKVPSKPAAPLEAIGEALATVPKGSQIGVCVNGTTIGLNALLQHKLPRVGLVATRGYGDLLYIRRETKENIYDLDWRKPAPLIRRDLTLEVDERIDAQGEIVTPLGELETLQDWIDKLELDDIAVCLIHSYRNAVHEQLVRDAILAARPGARVTLSSDVWPEWREFERTYNTALNAALKPIVREYADGLVKAVNETAGHENVYIMHADGGVLRPTEIAERPVLTLLSGTVAGALMGARTTLEAGFDTAVSLDMGGTSTDIGLSEHGHPRRSSELTIEWEGTLGFAGVDVVSIGAGGGSIGWADEAGGLHVGPASAGADPGPACYGKGGAAPTLTDAYLLLGYLGPEPLIGGLRLDPDPARRAFAELAERTPLDSIRLLSGIYEIANSNLAAGVRRATIERGVDPRSCALVCMGGAGPLHAAALVKHLDLASAVIPPRPGNGSALGLMLAPIKHGVSKTFYAALEDLPSPDFRRLVGELRERAVAALPRDDHDVNLDWRLLLRYRGQTRELALEVDERSLVSFDAETRAHVAQAFHARHEKEFTFSAPSEPIQLVTVRCEGTVVTEDGRPGVVATNERPSGQPEGEPTEAHFLGEGLEPEPYSTAMLQRDSLASDDVVEGPAIVRDSGSTILLPPGSSGRVDAKGNLMVEWRS